MKSVRRLGACIQGYASSRLCRNQHERVTCLVQHICRRNLSDIALDDLKAPLDAAAKISGSLRSLSRLNVHKFAKNTTSKLVSSDVSEEASELLQHLISRLNQGTDAAFDQARSLWEEYTTLFAVTPSIAHYEAMIRIHLQEGDYSAARSLMQDIRARDLKLNASTHNLFLQIQSFSVLEDPKRHTISDSLKMHEWMQQNQIAVEPSTYEALIAASCSVGQSELADRFLNLFESRGYTVSLRCLTPFIRMRASGGSSLADVLSQIDSIRKYQLIPNGEAFEPAIDLAIQHNDVASLQQIWNQMRQTSILPTPTMVSSLLTTGNIDLIRQALIQFKKQRVEIPWHVIFKRCLQAQRNNALILLVDKFLPRHTALMNNLLHRCFTSKSYQIGLDLFERMLSKGFQPDIITVPIIINIAGGAKNSSLANRVFEELTGAASKWKLPRLASTYTALSVACSMAGQIEQAFDVTFKMLADKSISIDQRALHKFVVYVLRRHNIVSRRDRTSWDSSSSVKTAHPSNLREFETELHRWLQTWKTQRAAALGGASHTQSPTYHI